MNQLTQVHLEKWPLKWTERERDQYVCMHSQQTCTYALCLCSTSLFPQSPRVMAYLPRFSRQTFGIAGERFLQAICPPFLVPNQQCQSNEGLICTKCATTIDYQWQSIYLYWKPLANTLHTTQYIVNHKQLITTTMPSVFVWLIYLSGDHWYPTLGRVPPKMENLNGLLVQDFYRPDALPVTQPTTRVKALEG